MISLLILEMEPRLCALWCSEYSVRAAHTVVNWCWTTKTGSAQPHYLLTRRFPSTWHTSAEKHTAASEGVWAAPDHRINGLLFDCGVFNVAPLDMWWMAAWESCSSAIIYRLPTVVMINGIFIMSLMCLPSPQKLQGVFIGSVFNLHIRRRSSQVWVRHRVNSSYSADIMWISSVFQPPGGDFEEVISWQ